MGFDPRRWRPPASARRAAAAGAPAEVTSNVDTLLAENDALRREVRALRQELDRLRAQPRGAAAGPRVSSSFSHGLTPALVERWGAAMAGHPQWGKLHLGPPGGLRGLIEEQRRGWWNPQLDLEQELNRRSPGLGSELAAALRGPQSRARWAVRAAFAIYGPRAMEWLSEDPLRVVAELLRRIERHQPADPRRAALAVLGLEPGASLAAIKRAYRRLAKTHHPDLGGEAEAFRRLDAAYRLLIDG